MEEDLIAIAERLICNNFYLTVIQNFKADIINPELYRDVYIYLKSDPINILYISANSIHYTFTEFLIQNPPDFTKLTKFVLENI